MNKWPGCPRPCEDTQTNSSPRQIRDPRNHGSRHHGDHLHSRDPGNIRFLLHNPGGVGYLDNKRCLPTLKMEKLKKLVIKQEFDFVGLCEVNKDWRRVQQSKKFGALQKIGNLIEEFKLPKTLPNHQKNQTF